MPCRRRASVARHARLAAELSGDIFVYEAKS